jgi:hypothetical protein
MPFPEPWELVSLFEGDPTLSDPDVPWIYNRVTFVIERGDERIEVTIHQADREFAFTWSIRGRSVVKLDLGNVVGLEVTKEDSREGLRLTTADPDAEPLHIDVSPEFRIAWKSGDIDAR